MGKLKYMLINEYETSYVTLPLACLQIQQIFCITQSFVQKARLMKHRVGVESNWWTACLVTDSPPHLT